MTLQVAEMMEELKAELRKACDPWRTVKEAALYLRCSYRHINTLCERGVLKRYYSPGGATLFRVAELEAAVSMVPPVIRRGHFARTSKPTSGMTAGNTAPAVIPQPAGMKKPGSPSGIPAGFLSVVPNPARPPEGREDTALAGPPVRLVSGTIARRTP